MKRWLFMLAALFLLAALPAAVSAAPPAHNYDCSDTTPTAYDARVDQAAMYYSSSSATNALASTAYSQFRSDAIFFFNGHGLYYDDSHKGGGIKFSSESWILAGTDGHYPGNDQYYIKLITEPTSGMSCSRSTLPAIRLTTTLTTGISSSRP